MIGDNIKRLMKANGYTQGELARRAGITEAALSRYVAGSREPHAKALENLAIALGVSVEDLISDGSSRAPTPTAADDMSEARKWYHEYHSIKDQLEREREYLRNEQKLSDKYFLKLKDALLVCELTRDRVRELEAREGELAREILSEIREAYERYGGAYGMLQKINELEQRFGVIDCTKCRYFVGCESCRTGQVCGDFERIEN